MPVHFKGAVIISLLHLIALKFSALEMFANAVLTRLQSHIPDLLNFPYNTNRCTIDTIVQSSHQIEIFLDEEANPVESATRNCNKLRKHRVKRGKRMFDVRKKRFIWIPFQLKRLTWQSAITTGQESVLIL